MKAISGVTFQDWAAASAHLAQGMSIEEVCKILGIEQAVWEEVNKKWGDDMGRIMAEDMDVATQYSQIFTNPKVGKFAEVEGTSSMEEVVKKVPDYKTFKKIFIHQAIGHEHGVDAVTILEKEYDLTLTEWSQASMHWSNYVKEQTKDEESDEYKKWRKKDRKYDKKYEAKFNEMYQDKKIDLADDIDF